MSFSEITAWANATGHVLNAWETQTLRTLSGAYLAELHDAESPLRPPPGGFKIPPAPFESAFQALMAMAEAQSTTPARKR